MTALLLDWWRSISALGQFFIGLLAVMGVASLAAGDFVAVALNVALIAFVIPRLYRDDS